jgi:predicted Zn-dependent protease
MMSQIASDVIDLTGSDSGSTLFAGIVFVISRSEAPDVDALLATAITDSGGKVLKGIPKRSQKRSRPIMFVVSWLEEDDGRLAQASYADATLVTPGYIRACISARAILDFTVWSEGTYSPHNPRLLGEEDISSLFLRPCPPESRELEEQPQPYDEFVTFLDLGREGGGWFTPRSTDRKFVYVMSLVSIDSDGGATATDGGRISAKQIEPIIVEFLTAFLGTHVKTLPPRTLHRNGIEGIDSRPLVDMQVWGKKSNGKKRAKTSNRYEALYARQSKQDQHLEIEVIDTLAALKPLLPKDSYALVIVTEEDLYEEAIGGHNQQLLGRAAGQDLVCLCSTYTLSNFMVRESIPRDAYFTNATYLHGLLNLLNTAVHEVLHIFALDHCAYYLCTMAAVCDSSSEAHTARGVTAVCLCPVCLRKLHYSVGFDIVSRYRTLTAFYLNHGFESQASWAKRALSAAEGTKKKKSDRNM